LIARLACVLLLAAGLSAQAAPARSTTTYRIAGKAVDSLTGQPLAGVRVSIYATENSELSRRVITGAAGHFAFTGLPAGKYSLLASALGYRPQGFNQHGDFFTGIAVGPELDAEDLVFRLVPDARIEGIVTDEDSESVRNANVSLFQRNNDTGRQHMQQAFNAVTDDRGHYDFGHLAPGAYVVAVSARPWYAQYPSQGETQPAPEDAARVAEEKAQLDVAYPMTFYPSVDDPSDATAITLHPSERVTADLLMRAVPAVHLRIRTGDRSDSNSSNDAARGFPRVSQRLPDGTVVPVTNAQAFGYRAGVFEYTGIAPGHYLIEMPDPGGKGRGGGWYKEMDLAGSVEIDARESPPLASVLGALTFDGTARPKGKVYVVLVNRLSGENFAAEVNSRGNFDFSEMEIRPGSYDIALNNAPGFQIKSLLAKGAQVEGKTLEISGGSVQVVCTATHAVARIDGTVLRGEKPYAGAMVVLVPRQQRGNWTLFRRDQSDSDGTFTLREVLPGLYTLIALENAWDLDWASPAVLQPYLKNGTPLEVAGEGTLSVKVQLQ